MDERGFRRGGPELAAEIGKSSAAYDLHDKKELYARAGVREYVVVVLGEPRKRRVAWFRLVEGSYVEVALPDDGVYRSEVFGGLWLDAQAILDGNRARMLEVLGEGLASDAHREFVVELQSRS